MHTNCGNTVCQLTVHLPSKYVRELTKFAALPYCKIASDSFKVFFNFQHCHIKQLLFDHLLDYIFFNFISFIAFLSFQLSKLLLNTSKYCQLCAGHSHSRVRLTSYTKIHLHRAVVIVVSLLLLLLFIHHLLAVFVNWFISKACL